MPLTISDIEDAVVDSEGKSPWAFLAALQSMVGIETIHEKGVRKKAEYAEWLKLMKEGPK